MATQSQPLDPSLVHDAAEHPPPRRPPPPTVDHVVVSVSLGSSRRNGRAEATLFGRRFIIERIGVDGDLARAKALFAELDGRVDALGLGGADFGLDVNGHHYPFRALRALTAGLKTPVTDGSHVRRCVERRTLQQAAPLLDPLLAADHAPRRALITTAVDRYDLACSFADAGYELLCGDLGYVFGLSVPIRSLATLNRLARVVLPLATRRTYTGVHTRPGQSAPGGRIGQWLEWATAVGGDTVFVRNFLPARLDGKIIVTNATTDDDVALLRARGARALVCTTPRLDGRTFGANVIEAALTALAGYGRTLTLAEVQALLGPEGLPPTVEILNPPPLV